MTDRSGPVVVGRDLLFEEPGARHGGDRDRRLRRSRRALGRVTTTAIAPSVSWQQSNMRMHGSAIQRDAWWSASVIGRW